MRVLKSPGFAHLGFVPDVEPAALEDLFALGGEDRRIDQRGPVDFETQSLWFVRTSARVPICALMLP